MNNNEKQPTGYIVQNDPVRKMILDNPDLPIIFLAADDACYYGFSYSFCSSVSVEIGEVLDCQQEIYDEIVFTDREEFEQAIFDNIELLTGYDDRDEEWYEAEAKRIADEYDPYWRKVIVVKVGN